MLRKKKGRAVSLLMRVLFRYGIFQFFKTTGSVAAKVASCCLNSTLGLLRDAVLGNFSLSRGNFSFVVTPYFV